MEIKPSPVTASVRSAASVMQSNRFFNPPLFVWDTTNRPYLTLSSRVSVQGEVTFGAEVGCGQQAQLVVYLSQYRQETFASRGKEPSGWGCGVYYDRQPFEWDFSKGGYPIAQMYLFDWQWGDGLSQMSGDGSTISYSFTGSLRQGILPTSPPPVTVTGTATATGSFLPAALFDHWELRDNQTVLTCNNSMGIIMSPTDGYGEPYGPVGISGYEAPVTVSLEGGGPYVFLSALGQEGTLVATTLSDGCALVFDPTRGGFTGEPKVVTVTVTGGGKSGTFPVTLTCERVYHFELTAVPTVLAQGMYSTLTLIAKDAANQEFTFAEDFDVTLTLFSPDIFWPRWMGPPPFGSFVVDGGEPQLVQVVVPYSVARAGRVQYFVESDILTTAGVDSLAISILAERVDDASKYASTDVKVKKNVVETICVQVAFDTSVVSVGGSTGLQFTKADGSGGFPAGQIFDVMIVSGGGTLISSSQSGTVLAGTQAPVRYEAPAAIEGDSMVVSVKAVTYSSGGGTPAGSQTSIVPIQNAPTLKKMPGTAATQSLSKKTKEAQMALLVKLLDDSQCPPPAQLTVTSENYPTCYDATENLSTWRLNPRPCTGGGETGWLAMEGQSYIEPAVCSHEGSLGQRCLGLMIPQVAVDIFTQLCQPGPPKDENQVYVNAAADVIESKRDYVLTALNEQINEIDEIVGRLERAGEELVPEGSKMLNVDRIRCDTSFARHEMTHRRQRSAYVAKALELTKQEIRPCVPEAQLTGLTGAQLKNRLGYTDLILKFQNSLSMLYKKNYNADEAEAHKIQKSYLNNLRTELLGMKVKKS